MFRHALVHGLVLAGGLFVAGTASLAQEKAASSPETPKEYVLELQEVESVKQGVRTSKATHYTVQAAVRIDSPIHVRAIIGTRGVAAKGRLGKVENGQCEVKIEGQFVESMPAAAAPPGVNGPFFNARDFKADQKVKLGETIVVGKVEDTNHVVAIATYLRIQEVGPMPDLVDELGKQAAGAPR